MMSTKIDSCVFSAGRSFAASAKAAASEAGIRGRRTYNKASNKMEQMPRKHVMTTAPNLSSLRPFASQSSVPASLIKRNTPHVAESKNRAINITVSINSKARFGLYSDVEWPPSRRYFRPSLNFGCF